jgi:hypothetical protein
MKDSNSIFQITLLKGIIVVSFLYILLNTIASSYNFFHDNADFGFWTMISFLMISGFILSVDIVVILFVCKTFQNANKRVYIFIFQVIICVVVYLCLIFISQNAEKWNEQALKTKKNYKKLCLISYCTLSFYERKIFKHLAYLFAHCAPESFLSGQER